MKKFEYKREFWVDDVATMNAAGREGWEAIAFISNGDTVHTEYTVIYKREIK